jgi:hypothetical protein
MMDQSDEFMIGLAYRHGYGHPADAMTELEAVNKMTDAGLAANRRSNLVATRNRTR